MNKICVVEDFRAIFPKEETEHYFLSYIVLSQWTKNNEAII